MFFIIREVIGWLLILIGLGLVGLTFAFLGDRQVVEASVAVIAATVIFRGGILLVRVSTAARICLQSSVIEKAPQKRSSSRIAEGEK